MTHIEYMILGIIASYTLGKTGGYAATWHIADALGVSRGDFYNSSFAYGATLKSLVEQGFIEEVPLLGERYRLKLDAHALRERGVLHE